MAYNNCRPVTTPELFRQRVDISVGPSFDVLAVLAPGQPVLLLAVNRSSTKLIRSP